MHFRFISGVGIFCIILCLAGCQKNASPEAAAEQPVATVEEHRAEENVVIDPVKAAFSQVASVLEGLNKIAEESGDDCAKAGTGMTEYLSQNRERFVASMRVIGSLNYDSPEARNSKAEMDSVLKAIMGGALYSIQKTCADSEEVELFSNAFVSALIDSSMEEGDGEILVPSEPVDVPVDDTDVTDSVQ